MGLKARPVDRQTTDRVTNVTSRSKRVAAARLRARDVSLRSGVLGATLFYADECQDQNVEEIVTMTTFRQVPHDSDGPVGTSYFWLYGIIDGAIAVGATALGVLLLGEDDQPRIREPDVDAVDSTTSGGLFIGVGAAFGAGALWSLGNIIYYSAFADHEESARSTRFVPQGEPALCDERAVANARVVIDVAGESTGASTDHLGRTVVDLRELAQLGLSDLGVVATHGDDSVTLAVDRRALDAVARDLAAAQKRRKSARAVEQRRELIESACVTVGATAHTPVTMYVRGDNVRLYGESESTGSDVEEVKEGEPIVVRCIGAEWAVVHILDEPIETGNATIGRVFFIRRVGVESEGERRDREEAERTKANVAAQRGLARLRVAARHARSRIRYRSREAIINAGLRAEGQIGEMVFRVAGRASNGAIRVVDGGWSTSYLYLPDGVDPEALSMLSGRYYRVLFTVTNPDVIYGHTIHLRILDAKEVPGWD